MKTSRLKFALLALTGCVKASAPLTALPTADPSPEISEIAPSARSALERELPPGFELTYFAPTGDWNFSRHPVSGIVTERSATAWVGLRHGTECFVSEAKLYQEQVGGQWAGMKAPLALIGLGCNRPETGSCTARFAAQQLVPAGVEVDVGYYVPGTLGLAARIPCGAMSRTGEAG